MIQTNNFGAFLSLLAPPSREGMAPATPPLNLPAWFRFKRKLRTHFTYQKGCFITFPLHSLSEPSCSSHFFMGKKYLVQDEGWAIFHGRIKKSCGLFSIYQHVRICISSATYCPIHLMLFCNCWHFLLQIGLEMYDWRLFFLICPSTVFPASKNMLNFAAKPQHIGTG